MRLYIAGILLILCNALFAQAPVVENVRFEQRTDGSLLVDIYYDISDADDDALYIDIKATENNGATWDLSCTSLIGDVGNAISPGTNKHVVWDFYADNPDTSGNGYRVQVIAYDNLCGLTITRDFTLNGDLVCPPGSGSPVLNIAAPNITLDLGGHAIIGDISTGSFEGVIIDNVEGTTIKNGTIEGFVGGIIVLNSDNTTIENMTIKNLDIDDPDFFVTGIGVGESQNVLIRNCQFEFLYVHHKQAMSLGNSNVTVDNIKVNGGSVGVDFGGNVDPYGPSRGSVINSRFDNSTIGGILIQCADGVRISNNLFVNSPISIDPAVQRIIRNITIEGNDIQDCSDRSGIGLRGAGGTVISNNFISNNGYGISLSPSRGCSGDSVGGEECFYSTDNIIRDNIVLGHDIDLYHCEQCIGNTWEGNTFETAEGAEIYTADPVTAREFLASVDSAAVNVAADAELLFASTGDCDTLGNSMKWVYIYKSVIQQSQYEFWYHHGNVIERGFPTDPPNEDFDPITGSWIDSDSAIVITDNMGGKEFRETFELDHIEMGVLAHGWTVHYFAQDTVFSAEFDALR